MASKRLTISYDQETDLLEISIGSPRPAIAKEVLPDLFVRYGLETFDDERNEGGDVVGFSVANLSLWGEGDLGALDERFPSGVLGEILQWAKERLVGRELEFVASEQ